MFRSAQALFSTTRTALAATGASTFAYATSKVESLTLVLWKKPTRQQKKSHLDLPFFFRNEILMLWIP